MKLPKNFLQKIQDFQNVYDREVFSRNKIQIIWSTHHMISQIPNFKISKILKPIWANFKLGIRETMCWAVQLSG